jgi:hypothetical protein
VATAPERAHNIGMSTLVIEHLEVSELPQEWVERLRAKPGHTVTVRIETEPERVVQTVQDNAAAFVTDDPAFGIWRDREDIADVDSYMRQLRTPRHRRDGSRKQN